MTDRFDGPTSGALDERNGTGADAPPREQYLELVGTHLRAGGLAAMGRFRRVSDYLNLLDGFFTLRDVVLLTRTGKPTRITMPELRVRLDDVTIVGSPAVDAPGPLTEAGVFVVKHPARLVVMTRAHIIYGHVYVHEAGSVRQFVDSTEPKFIPMTNVRVRWLEDRRLAARYPFAAIQRSHIVGVATEGTGVPRAARAGQSPTADEAEAQALPGVDAPTPAEVG